MYNHNDIKWVKNVKREDGTNWAYFDPGMEHEFQLNFSESQKKGSENLKQGEIVLLFQRVDKMTGVDKKTYLTHLITPLDDNIFYNSANPNFPYERRVAVIARANPRIAISTTPDVLSFYKPQRGKLCNVELLSDTLSIPDIQKHIWRLFINHFTTGYADYITAAKSASQVVSFEDLSALEGREIEVIKRHLIRERNPKLIEKAKLEALKNGGGLIKCECCDFVFTDTYGFHGHGFIECHHKQPIAEGGERITRLNDLAMVCSNCHRMLHRKNALNKYYSIGELKSIILSNRKEKNLENVL